MAPRPTRACWPSSPGSPGLLVTDHWYTRVLDPRTLVMTGLTRNGVWLIENGEITRPLRNFRFTQSYPQALAPGAVLGVGSYAPADAVQLRIRILPCTGAAPRVLELHRRRVRLTFTQSSAEVRRPSGWRLHTVKLCTLGPECDVRTFAMSPEAQDCPPMACVRSIAA